jgi:hypothetical protein
MGALQPGGSSSSPRFGVGNYGTMPRERALLVMPGYEYFKSDGLPAQEA